MNDPRTETSWWTMDRITDYLGADHVAWILADTEAPATMVCHERMWGKWYANDLVGMAAYGALGKIVALRRTAGDPA